MSRIAFITAALMKYPRGDARLQDFIDRFEETFAAAAVTEGYIGRPFADGALEEPTIPLPGFGEQEWTERSILTFSLWQNLESVFAFTYSGPHGYALKRRGEWFPRPKLPGFVAWWIADDHLPPWTEICERYECLTQNGPTAKAFNFSVPYGPDGRRTRISRDLFKRVSAQYEQNRHE